MIPDFVKINHLWKVLPPGIHSATLKEIEDKYAINKHRQLLFNGFSRGFDVLHNAGCKVIYLDGSFITEKPMPGDFDVCWDPMGVDTKKLDPVLLDFSNKRKNQKIKYFGEFFPSSAKADKTNTFLEYFQMDTDTGLSKGIILVSF